MIRCYLVSRLRHNTFAKLWLPFFSRDVLYFGICLHAVTTNDVINFLIPRESDGRPSGRSKVYKLVGIYRAGTRGDRARIESRVTYLYFEGVCSCLATKRNHDHWQWHILMFSHCVLQMCWLSCINFFSPLIASNKIIWSKHFQLMSLLLIGFSGTYLEGGILSKHL